MQACQCRKVMACAGSKVERDKVVDNLCTVVYSSTLHTDIHTTSNCYSNMSPTSFVCSGALPMRQSYK